MSEKDPLAATFEAHRGRLRGIAYRMLGSAAEAEDAVQEAWLRVQRSDMGAVENLGGWLTTVVARICLDMLRARDTRSEEPLDEEKSDARSGGIDPMEELALARSVGLALLVVLEELSPPERVAFVLHDLFDRPFAEIGPIIGKSEEATRQLASRARRRVRGAEAPPAPDIAAQCELVEAFLAASRNGELDKIVAMLDPDVVFRADSAAMRGKRPAEVHGAAAVSKMYKGRAQGAGLALLDGRPGIVVSPTPGQVMLLIRLAFADGRIAAIDVTGDSGKIAATEVGVAYDGVMRSPPIPYMQRTREWYLALGYDNPYRWAHHDEVAFQPLAKPLSQCTVALVTTAAPYDPDKGPQGPGAPYNARAKFFDVYSADTAVDHDVRIAHVAIDRRHTTMEDSGTWFPLPLLRDAAKQGRIGALARRFHGMPTNRSQRHTLEVDAPELLARCREDGVDAAVLVPNCPVCHQTLSLAARHLEANGIATIVMGCARDVVEHCGVPRMLFSDFPLGNAAGRPRDPASQELTLELALLTLESAPGPRTTIESPLRWSDSDDWKRDYMNAERLTPGEIEALRAQSDRAKAVAKEIRRDVAER